MAATSLSLDIQKAFPDPDDNISYDSTFNVYMNPDLPGIEVLYRAIGRLTSAGVGVAGKTITVTYDAGTNFGSGSDTTDADGYFQIDAGIQDTPGLQLMTADWAGDGGYLASTRVRGFNLKLIPTTMTEITIPGQFPEDQYYVVKGTITVNWDEWYWNGHPVELMDVDLVVNTVVEQTVATDSAGQFKLYKVFADKATKIIQVQANDTTVFEAVAITPYATMFIVDHWYPQPETVETDCYAWVLCIDPNSIRGGPMYYVLDNASVKPGLTDKTGTFAGQLNDNQKTRPADGFVQYAMYLLGDNKTFILDQDEFWVGLQRGPATKRYDPENFSWDPTGGTDGKGAGIHWLMGGYITKRYYTRGAKKRVTALLIGKCYMDVWKDQLFGTDDIPRFYEDPTSLDVIANDVLADVNAQQSADYKFTTHPTYWQSGITTLTSNVPYGSTLLEVVDVSAFSVGDVIRISDANGSEDLQITGITDTAYLQQLDVQSSPTVDPVNPGIQSILGYDKASATVSPRTGLMSETWQKQFIDDDSFGIMQSICETAVYEWRVNYLKQAMLYAKNDPPLPTNRDIRYDTNIRYVPEIVMGDTEDTITDVVVRDGLPKTYPADFVTWTSDPLIWYDILTNGLRGYTAVFPPAPPNCVTESYVDTSLVWDDENFPALCYQHDFGAVTQADFNLGYYVDGSGDPQAANMDLDLRTHRRFKFKWRHLTWDGRLPDSLINLIYRISIHTDWNDAFFFDFGKGLQETLGYSSNDRIWTNPIPSVPVPIDSGWKLMDLLLPEPDNEGNISYIDPVQMKGWEVVGNPDPTEINWISFYVSLPETLLHSGYAVSGSGKAIKANQNAGDQYIQVDNPENLIGLTTWNSGEMILSRFIDGVIDGEYVNPRVIEPKSAPASTNIRLDAPLLAGITTADHLRILAGRTFSFSQVRFERDFKSIGTGTSTLGPKRYRLYEQEEFSFQSEADSKVDEILNMEGEPRRWVKVVIDGDPEKEVGGNVKLYLDPSHGAVFQNVSMMVDDVEYKLESVNLEQTLTLSPETLSPKAREVNEYNISDKTNLSLRRTSRRGRTPFKEKTGGAKVR